ncbi:hypothetical protein BDV12DRAFT_203611 [Aspergillus spectabilis]
MFWACHSGQTGPIRRLVVHYSAPMGAIQLCWKPGKRRLPASYCGLIPTLYITASQSHINAFRLLLGQGARIDVLGVFNGLHQKFISRICSSTSDWALLRLIFEVGLDAQLRPGHHPSATSPLFCVIKNGIRLPDPPLIDVEMLLGRGADTFVIESYKVYRHRFFTPFTAAMHQWGYDAIPLLNLLLGARVLIHGPDLESPVQKPTHIPVFVVVERMALTGNTTLLDWCLYHGANINHRAPVKDRDIQ